MIQTSNDGVLLKIRILPNSSKNDIVKDENGELKIKVTAQPIENKANKAVVEYLSKILKVPKSKIKIVKGETSKDKTIFIDVVDKNKQNDIVNILH